eukprot:COSAG06_NODE_47930_length_334_cov_2.474576_2_plen_63_part_01
MNEAYACRDLFVCADHGAIVTWWDQCGEENIKRLELWRDFQFEALYASVCRQREVVEARRLAN